MNPSGRRGIFGNRRLLGDARRETAEAIHQAASKRRRLAELGPEDDEDEGESANLLGDDDAAIFADAVYEKDDIEDDEIYAAVDARMQSRRQKQRQARLDQELRQYRRENPTPQQQFADLKAGLAAVSAEQWAAIPDIGDYSVKKQKYETYTPAPDLLLESARRDAKFTTTEQADYGTDLASIGAGRTSVLGQKLDNAGNGVSTQINVDADGYLAEMAGVKVSTDTEIGDIKKARLLLKSVTSTNPKHAPGWIAAARLEETAGQLATARQLILEGCRKCPREEDVWIEAARLHQKPTGRRILAQAVKTVPKSVKVWLHASTLEDDMNSRKRVLRKGLEIIPRSAVLWKAAVELEQANGARILLSRAVECVPKAVEFWLALARLQTYEEAKETLRRAQSEIPDEPSICITAAQLEEAQNGANSPEIAVVLQRGVEALSRSSKIVTRERWFEVAEEVDRAGYSGTVKAIIENVIDIGIDEDQREEKWTADANMLEEKGRIEAARAAHGCVVKAFSTKVEVWVAFAEFERRQGNVEGVESVLSTGVGYCAEELLWLMLAKEKWKSSGAQAAREVLGKAFEANAESEAIWLAAAKVETESREFEKARSILKRARERAPSGKVYMKSAMVERQESHRAEERRLLEAGIMKYRKYEKLWLMLAQWHERGEEMKKLDEVTRLGAGGENGGLIDELKSGRDVYSKGVEECGGCVDLWIGYGRYEEKKSSVSKARAILERGRERCKGQATGDLLWRESAYLECRDKKLEAARSIISRGLKEYKQSGKLWALSVALEPAKGQKTRSKDAITACPQDAVVLVEVAKYIWRSGRIDKARAWLEKAVEVDADWGDGWATWLAVEWEQGNAEGAGQVEKKAIAAEPRHGDVWVSVSKKVGNEQMAVKEVLHGAARLVRKKSALTGVYAT